jgi:hypothetical protein
LSQVTIHSQVTDRGRRWWLWKRPEYGVIRDRQLGADLQPGDWTQGLPTFVVDDGGYAYNDDRVKDVLVWEM